MRWCAHATQNNTDSHGELRPISIRWYCGFDSSDTGSPSRVLFLSEEQQVSGGVSGEVRTPGQRRWRCFVSTASVVASSYARRVPMHCSGTLLLLT